MKQLRIMFVCTGNSARSQMAEGLARELGFDACSSGTEPAPMVNPNAVAAMAEKEIDIRHHVPAPFDPEAARSMDVVVTVCGDAEERCPALPPTVRRIHWPLSDPAKAAGKPAQVLEVFRQTRDDIERRLRALALDLVP